MNTKRIPLAQQHQPQRVIQIRVRKQNPFDRRVSRLPACGLQWLEILDLRANIRRSIQQKPALPIRTERDGGLRARPDAPGAESRLTANDAIAIPLRNAAAGSRTEQVNLHLINLLSPQVHSQFISLPTLSPAGF